METPAGIRIETAAALEHDVPCLRCRYNLRGLGPRGQCPECGHLNHVSVLAWEEDQRRRPPSILESEPRWIRGVAEGLFVAIVVFVLMVALAFAPQFMFEWKTTPRKWTLGVACTMWVLSWAATWKLSARDRVEELRDTRTRRILRIAAMMYLGVPFIGGLATHYNARWVFIIPLLMCLSAGLVATGAWFVQVGRLAARAGNVIAAIEARLLLFANVLGLLFWLIPGLDEPEDSLSGTLGSYVIQFGSVEWLHNLRIHIDNNMTPGIIAIIGVIVPLWSAVLCLRLLTKLRQVGRVARAAGAAGAIASDVAAR